VDEEAPTKIFKRTAKSIYDGVPKAVSEDAPTEKFDVAVTRIYKDASTRIYFSNSSQVQDSESADTVNMRINKISKDKPAGVIARLWQRLVRFFSKPIRRQEVPDLPPLLDKTFVFDMEKNLKEWGQILNGENLALKTKKGIQPPFENGDVVQGKYTIEKLIAEGGLGWVYEATDPDGREVAVKIQIKNGEEAPENLQAEAEAISLLRDSDNFVKFVDQGVDQDNPYYVMERMEGETLHYYLKAHPAKGLPLEDAISLIMAVSYGLRDAHEKNIIHADISPQNIWIRPDGRVLLFDPLGPIFPHLKPGVFAGNPVWSSPEQVLLNGIDVASDQYALGILFYRLLAGKLPFKTQDRLKRLQDGEKEELPDNPSIPYKLRAPLKRLMDYNPQDRYPDISEFIDEMRQITDSKEMRTMRGIREKIDKKRKEERKSIERLSPAQLVSLARS
jgi:serine/threonine protein kinase